ncbi:hypothetical protein NNRS527_00644 [Nitrosospira sp. NRS527]|nr:hypothetical protein NNRS527_00644 [Nitrosospira sp. NRS527]
MPIIDPMLARRVSFKGCRTGAANYIFYADISGFLLRGLPSLFSSSCWAGQYNSRLLFIVMSENLA